MLAALWSDIPAGFPDVEIDAFVVMPNHLHGIVLLLDRGATMRVAPTDAGSAATLGHVIGMTVGAPLVGARDAATGRAGARTASTEGDSATTLADVIGAFKSMATVEYIRGVKAKGWSEFRGRLWQRNYYEHVIRNERTLNRIRRYIDDNPVRWAFDDENPQKTGS